MTQPSGSGWFTGRSAIVTGAAHGIGRGIAELLETLGAQVIAVDKDERALEDSFGAGGCIRWQADLAQDDTEQLANDIWQRHGPVQLLVNNVGTDIPARFLDLSQADFDLVFNTNLRGPWFLTKQIARHLVDARLAGAIVFVSSLHDSFIRTHPHYSASKAAVAMLVKEAANELAPHGIRVNAVSPGRIWPGQDALRPEQEANARHFVPLGRVGRPADVARMVAVLLSDEWSGYVVGTNVRVDGGLGLHSWSVDERANGPPGGARRLPRRLARRLRRRSQ
jgi:glucose 1-dehydrogenase